ncbi:MAG: right-handed parallel beta-helix repeat-containing protein, partial [Planctomycetota bacterium]
MLSTSVHAATWFVDDDAVPDGNGQSWATAFDELQDALDVAESGDKIWLAAGTYVPSVAISVQGDEPERETFLIDRTLSIYGGFAGFETSLDERDIDANPSILSGDLNGDDEPEFTNRDDNALHVVTLETPLGRPPGRFVLDGLTIRGGHAPDTFGGGLYAVRAIVTMQSCVICDNFSIAGGAIYAEDSALSLSESQIRHNHVFADEQGGGGAGVLTLNSSLTINACEFEANIVDGIDFAPGGAILGLGGQHSIHNSVFAMNQCKSSGGAVHIQNGGAGLSFDAFLRGCTFTGNQTTGTDSFSSGGAVHIQHQNIDTLSSAVVCTCVFDGNSAWSSGALMMFIFGGAPFEGSVEACTFSRNESITGSTFGTQDSFHSHPDTFVRISNSLFVANAASASTGGGDAAVSFFRTPGELLNTTVVANVAGSFGGVYASSDAEFGIRSCIVVDNRDSAGVQPPLQYNRSDDGSARFNIIQNVPPNPFGNIDADPLFVDPDGPDGQIG